MVYLSNFHVIRPTYEIDQESILNWVAEVHAHAEKLSSGKTISLKERLRKIGLGEGKVQKRGVYFNDASHLNWEEMKIYNLAKSPQGNGFKDRNQFFDQIVTEVFEEFYKEGTPLPDHLIHVTCTGYAAPSGAQKIVSKYGNEKKTTVTHAYHMGCCASLAALRMAKGFLYDHHNVDIVHTELCSLHMNPLAHGLDQLVVQSLFGDGNIKYSLSSKKEGLRVIALHEEILPNSISKITWNCEDWGLAMTLDKDVPNLIAQHIHRFLAVLAEKASVDKEEILQAGYFGIHPGGVRIIEEISKWLNLQDWQVKHSREILQNYGNMSSATLPHIWEKMLNDPDVPANCPIICFAFGPGLTISGTILKKVSEL